MPKGNKQPNSELRTKLREKIAIQRITRGTKEQKENTLEKALKDMGVDQEKLKADLKAVKAQGGLTICEDGGLPDK